MSNPQTFYTVNGLDLSNIFQPISTTSYPTQTNYKVNSLNKDLNQIFAPYTGGSQAITTGFKVGNQDLNSIFEPYQPGVSYEASGNYTVYTNGGYTGIVFEYDSTYNGIGSINFSFAPPYASLILVGGGGGGQSGSDIGTSPIMGQPSGGGGGGVIYYQQLQLSASTTYSISVGQGGLGAPGATGQQPQELSYGGTNTTFNSYVAGGGNSINARSSIAYGGGINIVNGGGGGNGCYSSLLTNSNFLNNGGTNINNSNLGEFIYSLSYVANGGSSFFSYNGIPVNIPFLGISAELLCGGGGGSGGPSSGGNGGGAGNGFGGIAQGSSNLNGEDGINSILQGYGGGGGGGGNNNDFPETFGNGGNGGNGVAILYWPPYNISNSHLLFQSSDIIYTPYSFNGYIGYVINSGSGNIIFNSDIAYATLILVGGGGAGTSINSAEFSGSSGGGGGGGGGITYISNNLNISSGTNLNFSIGIGGTPSGSLSTQSSFGTNDSSYNYISYGGGNGTIDSSFNLNGGNGGSINTLNGGGGGGGSCGYNANTTTYGVGGSGGGNLGGINLGGPGDNSSPQNGGNSYFGNTLIPVPFYSNTANIYVGGGGGGGFNYISGLAGNGIGGLGNSNLIFPLGLGQNALNSIQYNGSNGCFGGGGGGGGNTTGGYGGNGVLILYWPTDPSQSSVTEVLNDGDY